eukprot:scpid42805/ scgid2527/ BTB/POZ domain-containing protein KCTD3; Renal carcinoma antigen NY-REN-45
MAACHGDIVCLNVGGTSFCTSRKTLLSTENTFFSSLLSGRHNSARDATGAIFIDRDASLFSIILHYLRTRKIDLRGECVRAVRDEAEFYGIPSLTKALHLVEEQSNSSCGGLFFTGFINPPTVRHERGALQIPAGMDNPVLLITGHQNYLAVAYRHYICVHRLMNAVGWEHVFTSPVLPQAPGQMALNVKSSSGRRRLLAAASGGITTVWDVTPADGESSLITSHTFNAPVDVLFFIGTQLVVMSYLGEVSVWNAVTQQWKVQMMAPIASHATVNSTMLLGCANGSIYYIDMEKFPLRMKDNDLLVTQVYEDPAREAVTALSVYFTKAQIRNCTANSLEIAYGTNNGNVRVIADHPETLGRGFQLLQTFTVHRSPITRVCLTERYLASVCSEYNHVRTWTVTRFRGNLSTQTFPAPLASFHVLSLEMGMDSLTPSSNEIGPFGYHHKEQEDQVFIQRVAPITSELYCRLAATGQRVCVLRSVDDSYISAHCVVDFDASNRSASCERSYIFTGHANGAVQMWDLTTAYELTRAGRASIAIGAPNRHVPCAQSDGPSSAELLQVLEKFDLRSGDDEMSSKFSTASSYRSVKLQLRDNLSARVSPNWVTSATSPHPSIRSMASDQSVAFQGGLPSSDLARAFSSLSSPPRGASRVNSLPPLLSEASLDHSHVSVQSSAVGATASSTATAEAMSVRSCSFDASCQPGTMATGSCVTRATATTAGSMPSPPTSSSCAASVDAPARTGPATAAAVTTANGYSAVAAAASRLPALSRSKPPVLPKMPAARSVSINPYASISAPSSSSAVSSSIPRVQSDQSVPSQQSHASSVATLSTTGGDTKSASSSSLWKPSHRRSKSASIVRHSFFSTEKRHTPRVLEDVISLSASNGSSLTSL